MNATIQRLIRQLELNENLVSTLLGAVVLVAVLTLLGSYLYQRQSNPVSESTDETSTQTLESGLTSSAATTTHIVAKGESLWQIAQVTYGDGHLWTKLAEINNLTNPNLIEVGASLDLPRAEDFEPPVVNTAQNSEINGKDGAVISPSQDQPSEYVTQAGDSLWTISVQLYQDGYQWPKIWEANKSQVPEPNILPKAITLKIP